MEARRAPKQDKEVVVGVLKALHKISEDAYAKSEPYILE